MKKWQEHKSPDYSCKEVEDCPFRGEGRLWVEKICMGEESKARLVREFVLQSEVRREFAKLCSSPISCPGRSKVPRGPPTVPV